jgi:propanol-preferring alcohol dehydrogenase
MTMSLAQGGHDLGAMWGKDMAVQYFQEARFGSVQVHELARDFQNYYYVCRPGHEIAGLVEAVGDRVPETAHLAVGDQVVVAAGWGDGICRQCRVGNEQICEYGSWPGFGSPGGYAEFIPVPYRQLIRVEQELKWEQLAPLMDAGVTPYRGIKKLRAAGALGPD